MRFVYLGGALLAAVIVVWWWVAVRPHTQPIATAPSSTSMAFYEAKSRAELLRFQARHTRNFDAAIAAYQSALQVRPDNAEIHNDLGATYYEKGRALMGEPVAEDLRFYSSSPDLEVRVRETLEYMESWFDQVPADPNTITPKKFVWDIPAYLLKPFEEYAKTRNDLIYSSRRVGDHYELVVYAGETARAFKQAEIHFWRAIDLRPEYAPAYRNLGALYVEIGRREDAIKILRQALRLEPQDRELDLYLQQLVGIQ
ncbi:MAG: hypothetical protein KatS3mg115_0772 [Candidatus Poribacteria bacterium]|nr:MAG: hypothetical protein KatS3mg115_0772 [Candidatus Poribacteria bacterium]